MKKSPPVVLQLGQLPSVLERGLQHNFDSHRLDNHPQPEDLLASYGTQCVGIVARGSIGVDASLIKKLPNLKIIGNFGVGYEKVDLAAAAERNIVVTNTPDVLTECVADLAVGLLIDIGRQISTSDRFIRAGRWGEQPVYPLTRSVHRKHVGIVGLGRIGQAIAHRLQGFSVELRYHNRRPVPGLESSFEPSILELARWADYLMVAVVGGKSTDRLISAEVLEALGPDGYLVNIARGSTVDEAALVEALAQQKIAGAALDVFAHEPHVPEALIAMENVVLTPHMASGTHETREAMGNLALQNLLTFFETGKALTPVSLPGSQQ